MRAEVIESKMGDKVPMDMWQIMDLVQTVATISIMPFIYATDIDLFLDPTSKMQLDYMVVALTVV